ncbi:hypothetical protein JCM8547_004417 [Rhodosporidiobolus lusitaniae]
MGNAASKAASKAKPSRIPAFSQQPIGEQVQQAQGRGRVEPIPKASETKSDAIKRDAQDPTFAANLASLGQVKVPGKGQGTFKTDNPMLNILAERQRAEQAAEESYSSRSPNAIRNQLSARTLANLLDERKGCKSQKELDELAREYGMDPKVVDGLAKVINAPSVSGIELPTKDPNEVPKKLAVWVDPVFDSPQPQQLADK